MSTEEDKHVFFGPYCVSLNMHRYAIDNFDSVINFEDVTNGFLMELAANCLTFTDSIYVLARLVKEDILENDKKRFSSIVSKVRMMYNQGKAVVKKSAFKQESFKEFLDKPFQLPSLKKYNTPSSTRSNTPSTLYTERDSSSTSSEGKISRRNSVMSVASVGSYSSIEEGNCWDPNADEQGNDMFLLQQDEEDGSGMTDMAAGGRAVQETEWIAPDHKLPAEKLKPHLTCGICKGYLFNAVTIIECAHFFCKSCIMRHISSSLHCPTCNLLIHPTDPITNMKHDIVLQDIVYRILPDVEKDETVKEKSFYKERNLPYPKAPKKRAAHNLDQELPYERLMTVVLEYAGASDASANHEAIKKKYLRVPDVTTVGTLVTFLRRKMRLSDRYEVFLFCDYHMLHKDLSMGMLQRLLFTDEYDEPDLVIVQYGVMFHRDYWSKLIKPTANKLELENIIRL